MKKIYYFYYLLLSFGIGCLVRIIPIILNFPYPVGYDTVNYYLPYLYHFENNWNILLTSFPIYITIVYIFSYIFSIDIYYSFLSSNVILYGFFFISVQFYIIFLFFFFFFFSFVIFFFFLISNFFLYGFFSIFVFLLNKKTLT